MDATYVNGWWLRTDGRLGPYNITPSQPINPHQLHNAYKLKHWCDTQGWSLSAICGMLGNFIHESTLSPAFIQETNRDRLPNSASSLSDVPNSVMINFYKEYYSDPERAYGIGLAQWDGYTPTNPPGQKLVSYCMRYGMNWYDGDSQTARLKAEYDNDLQFKHYEVFGVVWTWYNYVINTRTPEESADIWMNNYESPGGGLSYREANARWFYDYFTQHPTPPANFKPIFTILLNKKKVQKRERKFF